MFWCLSLSFIFPCSKPSHPAACFPFLQIQSCSSYKKANIHVHCEITTAVKFIDMSMIYILTTFLVRKTRNLCSQHSFKYVTCCRYVWSPHSTSEFQNLLIPLYWNLRYHFTNTFSLPSSLATLPSHCLGQRCCCRLLTISFLLSHLSNPSFTLPQGHLPTIRLYCFAPSLMPT